MRNTIFFVKRCKDALLGKDVLRLCEARLPHLYFGSEHAGWHLHIAPLSPASIVYSVGIGKDISFDTDLIATSGVRIFGFDPTPNSRTWLETQKLPSTFSFYPWGLSTFDGETDFFIPKDTSMVSSSTVRTEDKQESVTVTVKKLSTVMKELGHDRIDVLKMDIEGAEYGVLSQIIEERIPVTQILVEFHHRFKEIGLQKTKDALAALHSHGYRIYAVSFTGREYSFIKL